MSKIYFFFEDIHEIRFRRKLVSGFIRNIIKEEGFECGDINIIFCSDAFLHTINVEFLHHDYFTDIVTFDTSVEGVISGELYISLERVRENAANYSVTFREEMIRVMVHGILHLTGYDDRCEEEQVFMRAGEDRYIDRFRLIGEQ